MSALFRSRPSPEPPFDAGLLDDLLERAGAEALLVTSKHNAQYLLGGHRSGFFDYMDAVGVSRYLPFVIYVRGRPELAAFIGSGMEAHEVEVSPLWPASVTVAAMAAPEAATFAIDHLRRLGHAPKRLAVEMAFLPFDTATQITASLPHVSLVDGTRLLSRLRARKTERELGLLREASERVVAAMQATVRAHGPGSTKRAIRDTLRAEEAARGLTFEYVLMAMGPSHNRAVSDQAWRPGEVLSLDSGGNCQGYIGDLCRMAVAGEPDAELRDLLAEVDAVQAAARRVLRPGAQGGAVYAAAEAALRHSPHRDAIAFVAHGMGLVSHEVPHLTSDGPFPYEAEDADRPLEAGMVLSIETTLKHPRRGLIKLEDTLAVTTTGHEAFGDTGREWLVAGRS
jgi:Xaa-Pro aminopeptidase